MKYYSEETKKFYDSEAECAREERRVLKEKNDKAAARKADADKVEAAFSELTKARVAYTKALNEFVEKHGPYHKSFSKEDLAELPSFDWLFDLF